MGKSFVLSRHGAHVHNENIEYDDMVYYTVPLTQNDDFLTDALSLILYHF